MSFAGIGSKKLLLQALGLLNTSGYQSENGFVFESKYDQLLRNPESGLNWQAQV